MNSIPAAAIRRIEVLRDGAAAQYGSDALAVVINVVLREKMEGLEIAISTGASTSSLCNHQEGCTDEEKVQIDALFIKLKILKLILDLGDSASKIHTS